MLLPYVYGSVLVYLVGLRAGKDVTQLALHQAAGYAGGLVLAAIGGGAGPSKKSK